MKKALGEHKWIKNLEAVVVDPMIRSGQPVLKGTRMPISIILAELADGGSVDTLAEDRDLDKEMLKELLEGLAIIFSEG